jgi:hypothetical protein
LQTKQKRNRIGISVPTGKRNRTRMKRRKRRGCDNLTVMQRLMVMRRTELKLRIRAKRKRPERIVAERRGCTLPV